MSELVTIDNMLNAIEDGVRLSEYQLVALELGATCLQIDVGIALAEYCPEFSKLKTT